MLAAGIAAAQPAFRPPLDVPAAPSELAARAPLDALAMAGPRVVTAGQRGHILYSDDTGKTWTQARVPVSSDLTTLFFASAAEGWALGHEGVILHTADGGANWSRQLDGRQAAELILRRYGQPAQGNDAAAQRLQQDAQTMARQGADKPFLDAWFENEREGFAIGAFNLILRTEDGGRSWAPWLDRIDNPRTLHLYAIRPAAGTLFIVGEQGLVLKLDRERQRFVSVPIPYQGTLFGVTGDARNVIVFGLRGNAWRSTDGGATWSRCETGVNAGIAAGQVRADGSVLLVTQAGQLLQSRDEGARFERVALGSAVPVYAMAVPAPGVVALAGPAGVRVETVK